MTKLLTIELDSYGSTPKVFMNGSEIKKKLSVSFDWGTMDCDKPKTSPTFSIEYTEEEDGVIVVKTISFQDMLARSSE